MSDPLGQGPEGARGGHKEGTSRPFLPFLKAEGDAASVRSVNPTHSPDTRVAGDRTPEHPWGTLVWRENRAGGILRAPGWRGSRAWSIPRAHRDGGGAEPVTELRSLCPSSSVTLSQGGDRLDSALLKELRDGVRPGRGRGQDKLLPFVFERASNWPCLTCENVTHPESKRRMGTSDHCEPVYWKGERKEFVVVGFFS